MSRPDTFCVKGGSILRRIPAILILLLCVLVSNSSAIDVFVFDHTFMRSTGKPVTEIRTFSGVNGPAIIKLFNGGLQDSDSKRVSSSVVKVNGQVVFEQSNFNQSIAYLEREITIGEGQNTLEVTLKSKPGGTLAVQIIQNIEDETGFIKPLDTTKIVEDTVLNVSLVSDQIIIMFRKEISFDEIRNTITKINGIVIGYLIDFNVYQIEIKPSPTINQLKDIINQLNNDPNIEVATLNKITQPLKIIPDAGRDPEWNSIWDETSPSGRNWGLEAIYAPSAWGITVGNSTMKVGAVDGGFFIDHDDIKLEPDHAISRGNQVLSTDNEKACGEINAIGYNNHGTHVLGIIGAKSNNEFGITGIMWGKDLYVYRTDFQAVDIYHGISKLLQKGVKVINVSIGNYYGWRSRSVCLRCLHGFGCPSDINEDDVKSLEEEKKFATKWMEIGIQTYGEFLIVQAAGNDDIDAKWNGFFSAIEDDKIKSRILVIASVDYPTGCPTNCSYKLSNFSNKGSQIDIAAPGISIFSTIANYPFYAEKSGTSMAAPHVTGVAGLVWSLNTNLTASQVKQILVNTADRSVQKDGKDYNILNAKKAVECAQNPSSCIGDKIVFTSDRDGNYEIYVMNADGTNQTRLTDNSANDSSPVWSPDGSKIVFESVRDGNYEIYVMNADGTNQTRLTNNSSSDIQPVWSPDGTKIAFRTNRDGINADMGTPGVNEEIYVMNADGTNPVNLTNNTTPNPYYNNSIEGEPHWSPDGSKILFSSWRGPDARVWVMNADGTNPTLLTSITWSGYPRWSPDGSKISYSAWGGLYVMNADGTGSVMIMYNSSGISPMVGSWSPDDTKVVLYSNHSGNYEIYTMNADGSNLVRLTNNSANDLAPYWSP